MTYPKHKAPTMEEFGKGSMYETLPSQIMTSRLQLSNLMKNLALKLFRKYNMEYTCPHLQVTRYMIDTMIHKRIHQVVL